MVALELVHASNVQLKELGPGLVALFGMIPEFLHSGPWHSIELHAMFSSFPLKDFGERSLLILQFKQLLALQTQWQTYHVLR